MVGDAKALTLYVETSAAPVHGVCALGLGLGARLVDGAPGLPKAPAVRFSSPLAGAGGVMLIFREFILVDHT